ncbi:MAG: hypothetical protein H8K05_19495 [Nitrospira sp.]|nr:hypothetical protein [Nitrospira sp.]
MRPLEELKGAVQSEESLAHITQIETEALKEFDLATSRIEESVRKATEQPKENGEQLKPILKKKRVVEPASLVKGPCLETKEDVDRFLNLLRQQLELAIANDERIEIR